MQYPLFFVNIYSEVSYLDDKYHTEITSRKEHKLIFLLRGNNGTWRSLVAHSAGGRVVGGSNPLVPTIFLNNLKVCQKSAA